MIPLTETRLKMSLKRGGMWVLLVNKSALEDVVREIGGKKNTNIQSFQCETVEDVLKMSMLIDAFNTWTAFQVKEFIRMYKNPLMEEL
jgi:hypothetical protein